MKLMPETRALPSNSRGVLSRTAARIGLPRRATTEFCHRIGRVLGMSGDLLRSTVSCRVPLQSDHLYRHARSQGAATQELLDGRLQDQPS